MFQMQQMDIEKYLICVIVLIQKGKVNYKLSATHENGKHKNGKKKEKDLDELKKEVDLVSNNTIIL